MSPRVDRASELLRLTVGRKVATAAFERLGEATGSRGDRRKALRSFRTGVEATAVNAATVLYCSLPAPLPAPPAPLQILSPTAKVLAAPSSSSSSSAPAPPPPAPPKWHEVCRQLVEERIPSDPIFEGVASFKQFSAIARQCASAFTGRSFKRRRTPVVPGRALSQLELGCAAWQRDCIEEASRVTGENRRAFRKL